MKNSNVIIGGLAGIIVGLVVGYLIGVNTTPDLGWMHDDGHMHDHAYEEMGEHMYESGFLRQDGAMQHAMDEMMLGFRGKEGVAYEEAFLRGMIVHHLGAVAMAEELKEETNRPELLEFADKIINAQSGEIEEMQTWLETWFNNSN